MSVFDGAMQVIGQIVVVVKVFEARLNLPFHLLNLREMIFS